MEGWTCMTSVVAGVGTSSRIEMRGDSDEVMRCWVMDE